jgi:predicted porin
MKRSLVVLALVSLVFGGVASASVKQGEIELDFAGSLQFINYDSQFADAERAGDDNETVFDVVARLGYFLTDNIEVGATANGTWQDGPDTYGLGGFAFYNFMPSNQLVPYVGGQLVYDWATGDGADGLMWGPIAGVRYELNPTNDIFVEYQFRLFTGDLDDEFDNVHGVFFGIQHIFKK